MTNYLFFDNFKNLENSKKEKSLKSSLFSFNTIASQLINAGFYYKKIWKMPKNLDIEFLKLTKDEELFHVCNSYIEFDETCYINSILNIFNIINPKHNFLNNKSLVSMLNHIKPIKNMASNFSFFYKNIKFPNKCFNLLPNIMQLFPIYENELEKMEISEEKTKKYFAYKLFINKYFFLNLPDLENIDDVNNLLDNIKLNNLPLLSFPFFISEKQLDNESLIIFKNLSTKIPLKLYVISNNIKNEKWKDFALFKINLSENVEINNHLISIYQKHQTLSNLTLVSKSYIDFFENFKSSKVFKKETEINLKVETDNYSKLIKKQLKLINLKSDFIHNYSDNLKNMGILLKEIGNFYYLKYDNNNAKFFYLKAMELFSSTNDKNEFEKVQYNLAQIELNLCNTDFAIHYFSDELEKSTNVKDKIFALTSLGKTYLIMSKFVKALKYIEQAFQLAKKEKINNIKTKILYQLASVYLKLNDINKCQYYIDMLTKEDKNNSFASELLFLNCELSILKNNFKKAITFINKITNLKNLSNTDIIQKEVLNSIVENKSDDYNSALFLKINEIQIPYFSNALKIKLMANFKNLLFNLSEKQIISEIEKVKFYNEKYYKIYKNALIRKRISKIDNHVFSNLNLLLNLGINRNSEGFREILSSIGEYIGVGSIKISSGNASKNNCNFVLDSSGKICINSQNTFDNKLVPLLNFLANLSANFIYSPTINSNNNNDESPFLKSIIGKSNAITQLKKKLQQVADFDFPILIEGNSGTGKEMAAKAVHYCSHKSTLPFLAINCAALPENLIESQFFGHKKGSFTGAVSDKKGFFEEAGKGTVFLDEIGELSLPIQAKLLRVLQEKEVYKVGENKPYKINCRFVFATNRNLENEIKNKTFREDLYYRIAGIVVKTPDLNQRTEDIPLLAEHFLKPYGKKLSPDAEIILMKHKYNGNVRELQNILTTALVISDDFEEINGTHLPDNLKKGFSPIFSGELKTATGKFQKNYITKALEENNFNNSKTAKKLGITRQRLIQLKKQYEI